jgi:hypothetical protein
VLIKIQAEAARRGEDPYSSPCVENARAAQADVRVKDAFSRITDHFAQCGMALEGDGLGLWLPRVSVQETSYSKILLAIKADINRTRTIYRREGTCCFRRSSHASLLRQTMSNLRTLSLTGVVFGRRLPFDGEMNKT